MSVVPRASPKVSEFLGLDGLVSDEWWARERRCGDLKDGKRGSVGGEGLGDAGNCWNERRETEGGCGAHQHCGDECFGIHGGQMSTEKNRNIKDTGESGKWLSDADDLELQVYMPSTYTPHLSFYRDVHSLENVAIALSISNIAIPISESSLLMVLSSLRLTHNID